MGDRGQSSVEFLLVIGVGMVILLPATLLFFNYSQRSSDDLKFGQLIRMGNDIVNNAEQVYYYSDPSKIQIEDVMPPDVENITIQNDWPNRINLITFWVRSKGNDVPVTFFTKISINGTFEARDYSAGRKRISLEVMKSSNGDPYVDINFI